MWQLKDYSGILKVVNGYTNEFQITVSSEKLYNAITTQKGLSSWWTKDTNIYPEVGGIATFRFGKETYVVMKIAKLVSNKEVVWRCVEQHSKIEGTDKTDEWVGTKIKFSIQENKDKTTVLTFVHEGLTQKLFCYKDCKNGWDYFLNSLKEYLETGKGIPYKNK